ncbi:MAG: dTDP-4-amino-4,6-dideoxygalactose transaminase [Salibacteraceae bacterium]
MIRFNKPYIFGQESEFVKKTIDDGTLAGMGVYTEQCQQFLNNRYGFENTFLTHSCTSALEMIAILLDIGVGDEVIVPSFTYGATANAFALRGATIVFADSNVDHPNVSIESIEKSITAKTKVIVAVHYGGVSCDMSALMALCKAHDILLVEDAAHSIDSFYQGKPLGSFGVCAAFSFHETKNITCGEGGVIVVNQRELVPRAEVIWENGTNKAMFRRGEIDRYSTVDIGSSFYPSELNAAFLYGQLLHLDMVQSARIALWDRYFLRLQKVCSEKNVELPQIPEFASHNAHVFYLVCNSKSQRDGLIAHLWSKKIQAVFHYSSLHSSEAYRSSHQRVNLVNADRFSECLVRLPLHLHLKEKDIDRVCDCIIDYLCAT